MFGIKIMRTILITINKTVTTTNKALTTPKTHVCSKKTCVTLNICLRRGFY